MRVWTRRLASPLPVLALLLILLASKEAAAGLNLVTPNKPYFYIGRGTKISTTVTYEGILHVPEKANACYTNVNYVVVSAYAGIAPRVVSASCHASGLFVRVTVVVSLQGQYTGGTMDAYFVQSVAVEVTMNDTTRTFVMDAVPIRIVEAQLQVSDVSFTPTSLGVIPDRPSVGSLVTIATSGTLSMMLKSSTLSFPWPLTIEVAGKRVSVTLPAGTSPQRQVVVRDVVLATNNIELSITSNGVPIAKVQRTVDADIVAVSFTISEPIPVFRSRGNKDIVSQVFVYRMTGGELTVTMSAAGNSARVTFTSPGAEELVVSVGDVDRVTVVYTASYRYGHLYKTVSIRYDARLFLPGGSIVISSILYFIQGSLYILAVFLLLMALLLRRLDLIAAGAAAGIASALVTMIPATIIALVKMLFAVANVHDDPLGLRGAGIMDMQDVVNNAVAYTAGNAYTWGARLVSLGTIAFTASLGLTVTLLGLSTASSLAGLVTLGGSNLAVASLLNFLGPVVATLAQGGLLAIMAGAVLQVFAIVYPILVSLLLALIVAVMVIQLYHSLATTSLAPFLQAVSSYFIALLGIMAAPVLIAGIDSHIPEQQNIQIELPVIGTIELPFTGMVVAAAASIIKLGVIVAVLYIVYNRVVAALAGQTTLH